MAKGKLSLAELMGKSGAMQAAQGFDLSRLHEVLGEATPELPRNPVGRHRLVRALDQRFGPNWRSLPGTKDIMAQFDSEVEFENTAARLRSIKYTRSK